MIKNPIKFAITALLLLTFSVVEASSEPIELQFWHSMAGSLGQSVDEIVNQFNRYQKQYHINAVYKGDYQETLTITVAAFRAGKHPDMVQVFEVGTGTMIQPKGIIKPAYQLIKQAHAKFDEKDFFPVVLEYYADKEGHLLAMPFNSSAPVLYYNKKSLLDAGLKPPFNLNTWFDIESISKQLIAHGAQCGFSTTWPSWTQLENFSAWHNIPYATENNGFLSLNAKLLLEHPLLFKHLATFTKWQQEKIFQYGGRRANANALFTSGKCAMIIDSSGMLSAYSDLFHHDLQVSHLPYWPEQSNSPQNALIGGAALWALERQPESHYAGVAAFFAFLSKPDIQAKWAKQTGYIPVTKSAFKLLKQQGYYKHLPQALIALNELQNKLSTENSKGIRLGNFMQIRNVTNQALEAMWSQQNTIISELSSTKTECNLILERFKRNAS